VRDVRKIELNERELRQLNEIEKDIKKVQLLKRVQCIKLKNMGLKHSDIADLFNCNIHTITGWIKTYKEEGLQGLLRWDYKGRPSRLSEGEISRLKEQHRKEPFRTARDAKEFIKKEFGIDFHLHWVQKLLKRTLNNGKNYF